MLRQTIKFAFRSFRKSKIIHALNLFGLTLGLSIFYLVSLYIYQENSYERDFEKRDRIYQVSQSMIGNKMSLSATNLPYVLNEVPEIEAFTSFRRAPTNQIELNGKQQTASVFRVDSSFFDVFDFELKSGDRSTVLNEPNSAVISEEKAEEYFGDSDPTGQLINVTKYTIDSSYNVPVIVKGVFKKPQFKTQLRFDILVSDQRPTLSEFTLDGWQNSSVFNYIVASPGVSEKRLRQRLGALSLKYIAPKTTGRKDMTDEEWRAVSLYLGFHPESLSALRTSSDTSFNMMPSLDENQLNTLIIIAFAALLISVVNFINISTARASTRMKEVGVKRILGSSKKLLISQFMLESFILVLASSITALAIVEAIVKIQPASIGIIVDYSVLHSREWVLGLVGFIITLTIISGIYPAVYLSSSQLVAILKNGLSKNTFSVINASFLRKSATVVQFVFSIGLIATVITMYLQVDHLRTRDIGYDGASVIVLDNTYELEQAKYAFKNQLLTSSSVLGAAYTDRLPNVASISRPQPLKINDSTEISFSTFQVDESFFEVMSMEFIQGGSFTSSTSQDAMANVENEKTVYYPIVINEVAAKMMGMEYAVGEVIRKEGLIVGVVNDFVFSDLRQEIGPVMLTQKSGKSYRYSYSHPLVVKVQGAEAAIDEIQKVWFQFSGEELQYHQLDTNYDALIEIENQGFKAVLSFSVLAVIISCLGLLGLAIFTVDQRIHEFGIRKVLGASVRDIMRLFGTGFLGLIGVAFLLALPISIYALQEWLDAFPDRIDLNIGIYALTALIITSLVILTVIFQSFKAGRLNPVDTLRNE